MRPWLPLLALVLLGSRAGAEPASAPEARGAFLMRTATDTVMFERFERSPGRITGTILFRAADERLEYTLHMGPHETVPSVDEVFRRPTDPADSLPRQSATLRFVGDSCIADVKPDGVQHLWAGKEPIPYINPSVLMLEQLLRRAMVMGYPSEGVPMFFIAGGAGRAIGVQRLGADSVVVTMGRVDIRLAVDAGGAVRGGSIPMQGITIERLAQLPASAFGPVHALYGPPAGAPYSAESVEVPSRNGFTLAGTLTRPKGATGPVAAVITITGSGAEDRDEHLPSVRDYRPFREIADALGRRGIAVLRLDDRGFGESGGRYKGATTADFAEDIGDAVTWLRLQKGIDPARIALLGHSEGGMIAPMLAAGDPRIRAIVLMAGPALDGRRVLEYQNAQVIDRNEHAVGARRDSLLREAMAGVDSVGKTDPWVGYFLRYDPLVTARKVKTPVLILQGETDHQVTPDQAEMLEKAFRSAGDRDVTRKMFPATNHLFVADSSGVPANYPKLPSGHVRPEVLATLGDWLAVRLRR